MKIKIMPIIRRTIELDDIGNRVLLNPLSISGIDLFKIEYPVRAIKFRPIEIKTTDKSGNVIISEGDLDYHVDLYIPYSSRQEIPSDIELYKDRPELFDETLKPISIIGLSEEELSEYQENQQKARIREKRSLECFPIVNRGPLWYNNLTEEQLNELSDWYQTWLDAPETLVIPETPSWIGE